MSKKTCPLLMASPRDDITTDCLRERCAWWTVHVADMRDLSKDKGLIAEGRCAVHNLANLYL